jgi:WD40 repeat protein
VAWRGRWFNYVPYYAGHPRWSVLAAGAGYVLLAVMLAALPAGSPRSALAAVRASLRATWRHVASGDSTGTVALIDAATGRELARLSGGSSTVDSLAFSPDGTEIAGATYGGTVTLWSTATGHVIAATALPGVTPSAPANAARPVAVSFVRGGGTLEIGDARSGLYQWTTSTGSLVQRIAWACGGMSCDNAIAFSPDGSSVAVTGQGAGGRAADVWNTATGTLVAKVSNPADYKVVSAAFSANGAELAIGDFDGGPDDVRNWDMGEGLTFTPSAYVYKIP